MFRDHFANRTDAPQPQLLIAGMLWVVALICLFNATKPMLAWCVVGVATVHTIYAVLRFRHYYVEKKQRRKSNGRKQSGG